jgi:DNA mismatch repair protein MutL
MSGIIQLLPDNIANQIAAGEVIQRPASVVKELVENSVDAASTEITLNIKDAGKTLIQIVDNGQGMNDDDALMSFERHATSKLKTADDLFDLHTKGFRGEALASIAAIAHVVLETKQEDASIGTRIEIAGSKVDLQEPIARGKGTTISVKNLFFNVPARRNFLKTDNVETKHIIEEFLRVALAHPEIAFKLTHNNNIIHDLQVAGLRKRIVDVQGVQFNDKLVPVQEETDLVKITGFVGKPEFARKTRGEQYFFVNNRYFKDSYLHHAVNAAFEGMLQPKTFPSYFLFLEVPTKSIDINIHPTKTEIKFEEDRAIYGILRSAIKLALGAHNIAPTLDFEQETSFDVPLNLNRTIRTPEIKVNPAYNPFKTENSSNQRKPSGIQPNRSDWEDFYNVSQDEEEVNTASSSELIEDTDQQFSRKIIFHRRFLMAQTKSGILTIYIQRGRERLYYDELMETFMQSPVSSQQLMFPIEYKMKETERLEWENNKSSIERLGFSWDWQGADKNTKTLILDGVPSYLPIEKAAACIEQIIEKIAYSDIDKGEIAHHLILSVAQSSAKGADTLKEEEADHFIERLFSCEDHMFSPSGKKIMDTITMDEINKKFA